jgi:hypothetical protein
MRRNCNSIWNVMQVWQRTRTGRLRSDEIEVFVIPFDPIERRTRARVGTVFGREIARTQPTGDFGVARHDAVERVEVTVQITDGAKEHVTGLRRTVNGKP